MSCILFYKLSCFTFLKWLLSLCSVGVVSHGTRYPRATCSAGHRGLRCRPTTPLSRAAGRCVKRGERRHKAALKTTARFRAAPAASRYSGRLGGGMTRTRGACAHHAIRHAGVTTTASRACGAALCFTIDTMFYRWDRVLLGLFVYYLRLIRCFTIGIGYCSVSLYIIYD